MTERTTTESQTPAEALRATYAEMGQRHERVALQAQTHGDVGTRELAARLAGRLEGLRLAADILGVELPELDHLT